MAENFDAGKFIAKLQASAAEVQQRAVQGMNEYGEHVIGDAQELAPIESGFLQNSATTEPAEFNGGNIKKKIGFNCVYGGPRHEHPPEADAPPKVNPKGQWKFLSTGMMKNVAKMGPYIVSRVKT